MLRCLREHHPSTLMCDRFRPVEQCGVGSAPLHVLLNSDRGDNALILCNIGVSATAQSSWRFPTHLHPISRNALARCSHFPSQPPLALSRGVCRHARPPRTTCCHLKRLQQCPESLHQPSRCATSFQALFCVPANSRFSTMSEGQVTVRTRKLMRNPLLNRRQMVCSVSSCALG